MPGLGGKIEEQRSERIYLHFRVVFAGGCVDFQETEEHALMRRSVSELVKRFPDGYWRDLDARGEFPREFWNRMAEHGWFGLLVPEPYGGSGKGMLELSMVVHEVARSGAGVAGANLFLATPAIVVLALTKFGSVSLQQQFLPKVASGRMICAFALTEPAAGVNTLDIATFASEEGDGYIINGQKIWTTLAHVADYLFAVVRTKPKEKIARRGEGLSLFLIEVKSPGVRISRIDDAAMRSNGSNEVFLEGVRVPSVHLIGEVDKGWTYLTSLLNAERITTAAMSIGTGELVLNRAVEYARQRVVFARAIGQNQAIQFPLANAKAELAAAWLMTQKAAWLFDKGLSCAFEANTAAYLAARAGFDAADRAMQTLGGMAYARESDVERHWRDLRLFRSGPIPEEMVLSYIGQHVLGLPKSY